MGNKQLRDEIEMLATASKSNFLVWGEYPEEKISQIQQAALDLLENWDHSKARELVLGN